MDPTTQPEQIAYAALAQLVNELESDLAIPDLNPSVPPGMVFRTMALRIRRLRMTGDFPKPHGAETAYAVMTRRWRDHMDDNGPEAYAFTRGMLSALFFLGAISDAESREWVEHLKHCPSGGRHDPSRVWCGYCGDIRHCRMCNDEIPKAQESAPFGMLHCCSVSCGNAYADRLHVDEWAPVR